MIRIYGDSISGNCLKAKYVADYVGLTYQWIETSVLKAETRTPAFLALNPAGQVPLIHYDDGRTLAQSNAIMRHLAEGSGLIPTDPWLAAKMDEWLFWEQYSHETCIAVTRFHVVYQGKPFDQREPVLVDKGEAALDLMEKHLSGARWFVGDVMSLADIALFAYTQFAPDAGFSLEKRPNILRWLDHVKGELDLAA
jgi:glutathione S-transferase